ncbi:hypothetical protein [Ruminococcus sp.]|uniref:hypothetical protein n=1 Tax=Ruminococcus sp. TaxID=41978 RepID=UPI00258E44A3|nr:hypothetical protein [Ruminococcus sp.]MCR5019636.1 hypothetical protein [Ruminococcus sp.]
MKTKFTSQRKGAVLMTVTVVSVMMMVIIAAATSLVNHTNVRTNDEYRKKQAYYVASSCLRAFVAETTGVIADATHTDAEIQAKLAQVKAIAKSEQEVEVKIERLLSGSPQDISKSQPRWSNAKCWLKLERIGDSDNTVKAIATATYLGQKKTVVAYLSAQTERKHQYTPKALEIIGTDGGSPSKGYYENIRVYGSTGASDKESHNNNTLYKFDHNANELYGDVDINGSLTIQNANLFTSNPYYCQGVDDNKGCVLNVSRSLAFTSNTPSFISTFEKSANDNLNPNLPPNNYNYINVGEALVFSGNSGSKIGSDSEHQVDVYASLFYIGKIGDSNRFDQNVIRAMASTCSEGYDTYWDRLHPDGNGGAFGEGHGLTVNGNVYVRKISNIFNGDMVINGNDTVINGDLYVDGDLYIHCPLGQFKCNAIHMSPDSNIYLPGDGIDRVTDNTGEVNPSRPKKQPATVNSIPVTYDPYWKNEPRAQIPDFPLITKDIPYYYYPEHLLCEKGSNGTVSTIADQYKAMYEADGKTLAAPNATSFGTDGNVYTSENDGTGWFKPDHIVTDDCYIENLNNDNILIDLDQLPAGKNNLVVILKNGGTTANNNIILVKNHTDPESDNAKFCYFVSDSGVGTTHDEYGLSGHDKDTISTYDHSSFNENPLFKFDQALNIVMDFETFVHVDCYDGRGAKSGDMVANPTQNEAYNGPHTNPDYVGWELPANNIIMLFTEGSELYMGNNTLLHASIYMPKALFHVFNKGYECKIAPYAVTGRMQSLNVIGNVVCENYEVEQGNNNTIVYNRVSPKSMLAYVKGAGEEKATESFMLDHYDNH